MTALPAKTSFTGASVTEGVFKAAMDDLRDFLDERLISGSQAIVVSTITSADGSASVPAFAAASDPDTGLYFSATAQMSLTVAGAEDFRFSANLLAALDGSSVVVGHTALLTTSNTPSFQVLGTGADDSDMLLGRFSNDAGGADFAFLRSRDTTIGNNTIIQDGDTLGNLVWFADDGTDYVTQAARIFARVNGTPGADDIPTDLLFSVNAGGAGTTARLTLFSDGGVVVGSNSSEGAGTLSADGLFDDDGSLGTACYVLEAAVDGQVDQQRWDNAAKALVTEFEVGLAGKPTRTKRAKLESHTRAAEFETRKATMLDVDAFGAFWKANKHLPGWETPEDLIAEDRKLSHGQFAQRLWEMVEVQAVHIDALNQRVKQLETP